MVLAALLPGVVGALWATLSFGPRCRAAGASAAVSGEQVRHSPCPPFQQRARTWAVQRGQRLKWARALAVARVNAASRWVP